MPRKTRMCWACMAPALGKAGGLDVCRPCLEKALKRQRMAGLPSIKAAVEEITTPEAQERRDWLGNGKPEPSVDEILDVWAGWAK